MDLYQEESQLKAQGYSLLAGVDEVGKGCLAGPVFAAAVILSSDFYLADLDDSKKLTPLTRERLSKIILEKAVSWQITIVEVEEIDKLNILKASLKAMQLAIERLSILPQLVLVDGNQPVKLSIPQKTIIGGDGRLASIAAASIIAKVARDRYMVEQEEKFPQFSFGRHKGYGTPQHLEELKKHGPTVLHRKSFAPVAKALESQ